MSVKLSDTVNPYSERNPFAILGVAADVNVNKLKRFRQDRIEDIQHEDHDDETRICLINEANEAYELLSNARSRAQIELFSFDPNIGHSDFRAQAEQYLSLDFDFGRILRSSDEIFPETPDLRKANEQFFKVRLEESTEIQQYDYATDESFRREALDALFFER